MLVQGTMKLILQMQNIIQPYVWGSHTALAELMGVSGPTIDPQAELWMGAHPKAPSKVWFQNQWQKLDEIISENPVLFLGRDTAHRFNDTLPFLFKVLAVEQPLSIQAHPNAQQARRGFDHENDQGIPLNSALRNYRDNRPKPECVCALTPFWALSGFRHPNEIVAILDPLWPKNQRADLAPIINEGTENGLLIFFRQLLGQPPKARQELVNHVAETAVSKIDLDPRYEWIVRLSKAYPGDVGCLAPGFLNLICLQPGQALFLPVGRLHAYLQGVAIEVMANSDNVLRGGLTPKHLDINELVNILDFEYAPVKILAPIPLNNTEAQYPGEAEEFVLSVINIDLGQPHKAFNRQSTPEILLCIEGGATLNCPDGSKSVAIKKGQSIFITAGVLAYELIGKAVFYKASVAIYNNNINLLHI